MQRIEDLELPEGALRELIHNAIVHRNYAGFDTQMKVYDDHIWLWNAGELPQGYTLNELTKRHLSFPRNKRIAEVFYKAGFIESWGRGIQQVNEAFRAIHLSEPTIENQYGGTSTIIPRNTNFAQDNKANGSINGRKDSRKELAKNQQFVIELLRENNTLTATDLAGKANLGERTIYRILAELQKDGYVERVGTRKSGYWKIL